MTDSSGTGYSEPANASRIMTISSFVSTVISNWRLKSRARRLLCRRQS